MSYLGDRAVASTVVFNFTTAVLGTPTVLAGSPAISVYKNSTTESTTGVTLNVSYDSRVGMNQVVIDTSADGTFYATNNDFTVMLSAGTVGGVSVVAYVVGEFSLGKSNVANINSIAASSVTTIAANVGTTQPINFTGTAGSALAKSDMVDVAGAAVSTSSAQIGVNIVNAGATAWGSGAITAGSIASAALNGKGDWNVGKTGYSLSVTPPTSAQIATAIWTDTTAGDFTTSLSIGKSVLNGVTLGTGLTINGYTGNTPQTGDAYARIGAAGAGLTALGDTRIAHLNADIDSRMATYTQPTGFLAATFPSGTVANTTNITAGTITTVTNLTNAPTAGDLTTTMKTSVENAVWDATMSSHVTSLTTGAELNAAGSAGDPWSTALPGAYADGTAGKIIGLNIDAQISTRTKPADTQAAVTTVTTTTNLTNLPTIPANWITAAGINATALNGKGDWNVGKTGYSITGTLTTLDGLATHGDSAWATAVGFATPTNITAGTITTVTNLTNAPTNGDLTTAMKASVVTAADTAVAPVKTQTDKMAFSVTNQIDANIQYVNDVQVNGDGSLGTPWGP